MPSYDLSDLSSEHLFEKLAALVVQDNHLTADLLAHIGEVDARGSFLEQACSTMFNYCVRRLKMTEACAWNRIVAARAARRYPAIYGYVAEGEMPLTSVKLLAPRLTPENHRELLESSRNLSTRGVEKLIATRFPKPDVAPSVRKLPERRSPAAAATEPATSADAAATAPSSAPTSTSMPVSDRAPQGLAAPSSSCRAEVKPLSAARYILKLTISSATHEKLLRAQDLMRHRLPGGELDTVLDRALDALLSELGKKKFGETKRPRKGVKPPREGSRQIPNAIKREVAARDEHRCTFVDAQGRRCEERAFLEFDHILPVARGGTAKTADEVRLRCRAHNRHAAEQAFGRDFVKRKIDEARRRRAAVRSAARRAPPTGAGEQPGGSRSASGPTASRRSQPRARRDRARKP